MMYDIPHKMCISICLSVGKGIKLSCKNDTNGNFCFYSNEPMMIRFQILFPDVAY